MKKQRLDLILVERRLVETRSLAQRLVMAGQVRVDDQVVLKPSTMISPHSHVAIDQGPQYVSRGGEKLAYALTELAIPVVGCICADVGASTGGFTDCLLQFGAKKVYAIDVGSGILHWKLRQDERVIVMEGSNARYLETIPEPVSIVTVDVSFISLKVLLPVIHNWLQRSGWVIALIKPQFEAGRSQAARGDGVIRDPEIHRSVLQDIISFAIDQHFTVKGILRSPLLGPKGNVEFLVWLGTAGENVSEDAGNWINSALMN